MFDFNDPVKKNDRGKERKNEKRESEGFSCIHWQRLFIDFELDIGGKYFASIRESKKRKHISFTNSCRVQNLSILENPQNFYWT